MTAQRAAWCVHLLTASGVCAGVLALEAAYDQHIRVAFLWMMLAVFIDSIDGSFARRLQVEKYAPQIDGRRLDDMVDFFTWVIVPVLAMSWWGWLPPGVWALPLMASALGMANQQAKTDDDYFLGFPSLWNVVALYFWQWQFPATLNGSILVLLALLVMLPVRFIYPSKTAFLKRFNVLAMVVWGVLVVLGLASEQPWAARCLAWSNFYPVYYVGVSLWLHFTTPAVKGNG